MEKLVKERTADHEKAYNSLKESEKGLAEEQKMAHIGNLEWDIRAEKSYRSDELYRIFSRDSEELYPTYQEFLNYIHPDDREYFNKAAERAVNGTPYIIDTGLSWLMGKNAQFICSPRLFLTRITSLSE